MPPEDPDWFLAGLENRGFRAPRRKNVKKFTFPVAPLRRCVTLSSASRKTLARDSGKLVVTLNGDWLFYPLKRRTIFNRNSRNRQSPEASTQTGCKLRVMHGIRTT
jgi:hypothetical protein